MGRSVEELHALLVFLGIEDVDEELEDKKKLVELIMSEKKLSKTTQNHAAALSAWQVRSSGMEVGGRGLAISVTERAVTGGI